METQISDSGAALMTSLTGPMARLVSPVPKIVAFAVIVVAGKFIASFFAKATAVVLRKVEFNELARRCGATEFVNKMGSGADPADVFHFRWVLSRLYTGAELG